MGGKIIGWLSFQVKTVVSLKAVSLQVCLCMKQVTLAVCRSGANQKAEHLKFFSSLAGILVMCANTGQVAILPVLCRQEGRQQLAEALRFLVDRGQGSDRARVVLVLNLPPEWSGFSLLEVLFLSGTSQTAGLFHDSHARACPDI